MEIPRSFSISIQSLDGVARARRLALTAPAAWMAPP